MSDEPPLAAGRGTSEGNGLGGAGLRGSACSESNSSDLGMSFSLRNGTTSSPIRSAVSLRSITHCDVGSHGRSGRSVTW